MAANREQEYEFGQFLERRLSLDGRFDAEYLGRTLDDVVEWIEQNLAPEDVFGPKELDEWEKSGERRPKRRSE